MKRFVVYTISGDTTAGNMEQGTRTRLLKFLIKDKMGMRKCLLSLFLQARNYTTCDVYYHLKDQGFKVNYRMVSAMVGQMHTRLGILRIYLNKQHNVYSLKESHRDTVKMVLSSPAF